MATITGGSGNDTLISDGDTIGDQFFGLGGNDSITGGNGTDTLDGGAGNDTLNGGGNYDVADYRLLGAVSVNLTTGVATGASTGTDTLIGIEDVFGSNANDTLTGNAIDNWLYGYLGDDSISGSSGNDTINGGDGNDSLDGGVDSDLIDGGIGNDTILGGQRWDTLTGGDGDDVIDGGTENDRMVGGIGNDTYYIDHVGDRAVENAGEGTDTVYSSIDWAMTPEIEHMFLIGTAIAAVGNGLNNRITGNASNNVINGGNGADTITGGAGADTLTGGTARDDFVFSSAATNGTDRITDFVHAIDRLVFKGSDYGFAAGAVLTAAQFTVGSAAVGTGAQFIWDAATGHLYWDADGTGAGARIDLALFDGVPGITRDDLVFTA